MRNTKRLAALLVTIAACAATLLGVGVAIGNTSMGNSDSNSALSTSLDVVDDGETISAGIDMYWNKIDANGNACFDSGDNRIWTQDASEYRGVCAASTAVRLIRNGVDVALITFDGEVDAVEQNGTIGGDTFSWKETSPWHIEVNGLPKESSDGSTYNYLIIQNQVNGFVLKNSERGMNASDSLFARFYNYKDSSSLSVIPVSACWKDGGDVDSRKSIKVGLYAARDISAGGQRAYNANELIATVDLNSANSWYAEVEVPAPGLSLSNRDFYIRELSTYDGSGPTNGKYRVVSRDEVSSEAVLNYWPENDTDSRMVPADPDDGFVYKVTYSINRIIGSFEVTNQRVGSVEVEVKQNWLDVGADTSLRPNNAFTLTCSSDDYTFVYDAGALLYTRSFDYPDRKLYKRTSSDKLESLTGYAGEGYDVSVSSSSNSMTFKLENAAISSSFAIVNLPKYDSRGALVEWKIEHAWLGEHGDYEIESNGDVVTTNGAWHHGDKLTFSFTNKRVGTKSVTYHAKWFDHYVKDELKSRPDVKLELYRLAYEYRDNDSAPDNSKLEAVSSDAYDVQWFNSASEDRVANDANGDFTQYATIKDLPKYDDHGKLCVYYALASVDASSGAQSGVDYSYNVSVSKDGYSKDPGSWNDSIDELGAVDQEALTSNSVRAYREDSTFNFRIEGTVEITGDVQWANIPDNQADALPDVSIYAQRRLATGSYDQSSGSWTEGVDAVTPWSHLGLAMSQSDFKGYTVTSSGTDLDSNGHEIADGKTAVAWTSDFSKNGNTWSYSITALGDNAQADNSNAPSKLDAFDSEGRRYEYRVCEVIDGAVGSAAFNESKFVSASSTNGPEEAFAKLYGIGYDGYSITNSFCSEKSTLTVNELFDGSDVHPDSSFKLFRFWQDGTSKSELKAVTEAKLVNYSDSNNSVEFSDLDTYTLAGEKWRYVPVEVVPDHFAALSALGAAQSSSADYKTSSEWAAANGVSLPADETGNLSMGPAVEFADDATVASVTFKNSFEPGVATLKGSIAWVDRDGVFATRPDSTASLFKLTRAHQDGSQSVELALQSDDPAAENYLVWTSQPSGDANVWTYEIRNVQELAPDLKPWNYSLTEDLSNTQYKLASTSSSTVFCSSDQGSFPPICNELKGEVSFGTSWKGDSSFSWYQRPDQYVALQARKAGSDGEWEDVASFFKSFGVNLADASEFEKLVGSQDTSSQDYSGAWNHLPLSVAFAGAGAVDVEYRAVVSRYVYAGNGSTVDIRLVCTKDGAYSVENDSLPSAYLPNNQDKQESNHGAWSYDIVNVLLTSDIKGGVVWNDYGSGLASLLDPTALSAKLRVSLSIDPNSSSGAIEELEVVPEWVRDADGAWSYFLKGLPKFDLSVREYSYRVVGCKEAPSGWHFAGTNSNDVVSFDASRLTFDAVDGDANSKLKGVVFEVSHGSTKVATWSRDNDGMVKVSVEDGFGASGTGASEGWVVGLPAVEYTAHEATVPAGYQAIADFKVIVDADGSVSLGGNPSDATLESDGFTVIAKSKKATVPSVPSGGGDNAGISDNDKPDKPGDSDSDDGVKFISEPVLNVAGSIAEDGSVIPVISATFTSADGKSQVTLSSNAKQLDIELVDVASGTCKVRIKPGFEPAGYKGDLSEAVVVNLFEVKNVSLEEVQKATGSKSGYVLYRSDDGTVYKVVISKNNIKVSSSKKTLKASSVKKGKKKFTIIVTDAKGKVTYKSSSKRVKVSKKGVVTVKKSTKKGTYKISVISQATDTYAKVVKTVKFRVK